MKKQYQQLTIEEREKISEYRWQKLSWREIGRRLDRSHTTIVRELERNGAGPNRKYTPRIADQRARQRIQLRGQRPRLKKETIRFYVINKLKNGWSPEQIAGRLPLDHPGNNISHEAIYQYVYASWGYYENYKGEDLRIYLRRKQKRRQRKNPLYQSRKQLIPNRIGIEKRPGYIKKRIQLGHWEGDSMVSKKSTVALNTLVERVSGLSKITKLPNLKPAVTAKIVTQRFQGLPASMRRTLTLDNGIENAKHGDITETVGTYCYFANPYHSWERGTNENTNGLIRWYLPKGTDFAKVSDEYIQEIEYLLNTRPRKRLGYKTPLEIFTGGALKR